MSRSQPNIQDLFLNQIRKENIAVTIYLVNGVQLRGTVRGFDPFTILLDSPGRPTQMVYKHAVTSVVPSRPITIGLETVKQTEQQPDVRPPGELAATEITAA